MMWTSVVQCSLFSVLRLWRVNMFKCFNSSSYDKLRNVGISFIAGLCINSSKFWSLM